MKRILFVIPKFAAGGAEKSLLMILKLLSGFEGVEIDLMFFRTEGMFLSEIPSNVRVLKTDKILNYAFLKCVDKSVIKNAKDFIRFELVRQVSGRYQKRARNAYEFYQKRWVGYLKKKVRPLSGHYDYACGFLDGDSVYFVVDKTDADVKYGWNQNTFSSLQCDEELEGQYLRKLDRIITVSELCERDLLEHYTDLAGNISVIPPIISYPDLLTQATAYEPEEFRDKKSGETIIVTVARLVHSKGIDLAIGAAALLHKKGIVFRWIIIGNGKERSKYEKLISVKRLKEQVLLPGENENPYPYIRKADIFVQPSRFEGKSLVLTEAKMLQRPIVVTGYLSASDQIEHRKNGIIADISSESLAKAIEELIDNKQLRESLQRNLALELNKEDSSEKIRRLFDL